MKQNLLGSQKYDLPVDVISLQLSMIMIESLIHLGTLSNTTIATLKIKYIYQATKLALPTKMLSCLSFPLNKYETLHVLT